MTSNSDWELKIKERVHKELSRFPAVDRNKIIQAIGLLCLDPYAGDVEKMKGEEHDWRRRVGAYRIFYELMIRERVIYVYHVERRTSKTY